jgi:hypothetical protein
MTNFIRWSLGLLLLLVGSLAFGAEYGPYCSGGTPTIDEPPNSVTIKADDEGCSAGYGVTLTITSQKDIRFAGNIKNANSVTCTSKGGDIIVVGDITGQSTVTFTASKGKIVIKGTVEPSAHVTCTPRADKCTN